jgi:hypothetical protein
MAGVQPCTEEGREAMKPVRAFVRVGRCWVNAASSETQRSVDARAKIDGSSWTSAALSRIDRGSKTQLPLFGRSQATSTFDDVGNEV